jgi:DNA-binding MarR family transcriptional regulator
LVRDGLVERHACISDRRGMLAVLSPAGRAILREAAPTHVSGVRRYVFESLERRQVRQMTTNLKAISDSLANPKRQSRMSGPS